jgi:branched-chain amino acid transport system permease protein
LYKYLDDTLFGACCLATKINETKLEFIGYDNFKIRLTAFVIANTTTALAGSLYAIYLGSVSPEITGHSRTADPVVVTILGGVGSLWGPIVGTLAYTGLRDVASKFIGNWELIVGFILVFIMMTNSVGLYGTLENWTKSLWRRMSGQKGNA